MTWSQRVGDLALNLVQVIIHALTIISELWRQIAVVVDRFFLELAEAIEAGKTPTPSVDRSWARRIGDLFRDVAILALQVPMILTVLHRQLATKVDEFLRGLAETPTP